MPKSDLLFESDEYTPVADRITLFYARYPTGRIITDLVSRARQSVVFRARVYREGTDRTPAATGWASEREGDGEVNTVACLENTETSAVGRALANLGFTGSSRRPSREEMQKAARARMRQAATDAPLSPLPRPVVREAVRAWPSRLREPSVDVASIADDLLGLVDEAEAAGLPAPHAAAARRRLRERPGSIARLERLECRLREWLASQADAPRVGPLVDAARANGRNTTPDVPRACTVDPSDTSARVVGAHVAADLAQLIAAAERAGVRPARAAAWRTQLALALEHGTPRTLQTLQRAEQRLRVWLDR